MDFQELIDVALSALIKLLIIAIPILFAFLTRAILQFLKQKEAQLVAEGKFDQLNILKEFAEIAIFAAEQMYSTNGTKFTYAAEQLVRLAAASNIPLAYADAQVIIEGSLKAVKEQVTQYELLEIIEDNTENISGAHGEINIFQPDIE